MFFRIWNREVSQAPNGIGLSAIPVLALAFVFVVYGLLVLWMTLASVSWVLSNGFPFSG